MKRKILVLFTSEFPNTTGGRETALYNLIKHVSLDEIDWKIISYRNSKKPVFQLPESIDLVTVRTNFIRKRWLWSLSYPFSIFLLFFKFLRMGKAIIKNEKIDYILIFGCGLIESCSLYLRSKFKIPIIISYRTNYKEEVRSNPIMRSFYKCLKRLEIKMINKASIIFANGRDTQKQIENINPCKSVTLLYNGVSVNNLKEYDSDKFLFLKSTCKFTIVSLASLRSLKGIDHVLKALSILDKSILGRIQLIIAGKGSDHNLKELVRKLYLEDNVKFLGEIEHKLIPSLLLYCDLSIFPGLNGVGLSHACLESLAAGVPIVAYNYADFSRVVVNGKTGLLVEKGNYESLAAAIKKIATNKIKFDKRDLLSMASQFEWSVISTTFLSTIEEMENI